MSTPRIQPTLKKPLFFFVCVLFLFSPFHTIFAQTSPPVATTSAVKADTLFTDEIELITGKNINKISIPGLSFSDPKILEVPEDGKRYLIIPFLGEYIAAIYQYGIIVISIIGVIVIIRAGLIMTLSGGDAQQVTHAKELIGKGILGIGLAIGSYTILHMVNPKLVQFEGLRVPYVEQIEIGTVVAGEFSSDILLPGAISPPPYDISELPINNVPLFYQCARGGAGYEGQNWGDIPYGTLNGKPATICDIGCGITSMAMILTYYRNEIDPTELELGKGTTVPPPPRNTDPGSITAWVWNNNIKKANVVGTSGRTFDRVATAYGMKYKWGIDTEKAKELLKEKKPLIGYVQNPIRYQEQHKPKNERLSNCKFTTAGHYIAVTGYDEEKKTYTTNDPGTRHWKKKGLYAASEEELEVGCKVRFIYVGKDAIE